MAREGDRGAGAAREQRRAGRREQMVQAAIRAVRRVGAGVSVADIAAVAGITKPVLYRFFTDRADLQRAVGEQVVADLRDRLTRELQRDREPAEQVLVVIDTFLAGVDEDPELWRFVLRGSGAGGVGAGDVVDDAREEIARLLAVLLGERLRERGLDSGGAEAWAHGLVGMVHSTAVWWLQHRTMTRAALAERLSTLVWSGLLGVGGTGTSVPRKAVHER